MLGFPKHGGKDEENLTHFFRHYLFFVLCSTTIRVLTDAIRMSADRIRLSTDTLIVSADSLILFVTT